MYGDPNNRRFKFALLAIGLAAFCFIRSDWICRQISFSFDKKEGVGKPEFDQMKRSDPEKFKKIHLPYFKKRLVLALIAKSIHFEKKQATLMYERMLNLYGNSVLQDTPEYEKALYEEGQGLQRIFDYDGARDTYRKYLADYPDGLYKAKIREEMRLLDTGASRDLGAPGGL